MTNSDDVTGKTQNIIDGPGSGKTNALLNVTSH